MRSYAHTGQSGASGDDPTAKRAKGKTLRSCECGAKIGGNKRRCAPCASAEYERRQRENDAKRRARRKAAAAALA